MKTWADVEEAARSCVVLRAVVEAVNSGRVSKEDALMTGAVLLSNYAKDVIALACEPVKTRKPFRG